MNTQDCLIKPSHLFNVFMLSGVRRNQEHVIVERPVETQVCPTSVCEARAVCTAGGRWEAKTICLRDNMMTNISCMVGCTMCCDDEPIGGRPQPGGRTGSLTLTLEKETRILRTLIPNPKPGQCTYLYLRVHAKQGPLDSSSSSARVCNTRRVLCH